MIARLAILVAIIYLAGLHYTERFEWPFEGDRVQNAIVALAVVVAVVISYIWDSLSNWDEYYDTE